jgi:predicted N-acetyltransferase YhbS
MSVQYVKAGPADYDEVIDFGNYVFSAAHSPHDFPVLLPKLYRREYFSEGIHYLAKEDGKIKAAVGAYPLSLRVCGETLPGRGIGMVSVHPYARSRGYMRALMGLALEDMRRDGVVFSCLGGQRQRYEYFGYTPTGTQPVFECRRANVRHVLGRDFVSDLSLRLVGAGDTALLDEMYRLHEAKIAGAERQRERFFDILSSWNSQIFAVLKGESFFGYLVYYAENGEIGEINLIDYAGPSGLTRLAEVVGLLLNFQGKINDRDRVSVMAQPHEKDKLAALSRFAEEGQFRPTFSFNIFDYPRFLSALLKLKCRDQKVPDGSWTVQIEGRETLTMAVIDGSPAVSKNNTTADAALSHLEAMELFFSFTAHLVSPIIRGNPFLQNLLPLPLSFELADGV